MGLWSRLSRIEGRFDRGKLEASNVELVLDWGEMKLTSYGSVIRTRDKKAIPLDEIINALLDHCDLEIEAKKVVPASLKKKAKKK